MVLRAIQYTRGHLSILDQLKLPYQEVYREIHTVQDAWDAIHTMQVRGAPAIAIVAALSVAVCVSRCNLNGADPAKLGPHMTGGGLITHNLQLLLTSRPTAVNLGDAVQKLRKVVSDAQQLEKATDYSINEAYIAAAEKMLVDDVKDNESIGNYGADWILRHCGMVYPGGSLSVLTHCNTGSLATAGYGTALGVIRSLHARGFLRRAYYTETRPYNQGSRLTGYELMHDNIPSQEITDSMAGALMGLKRESENLSAVIVGADRVAANGDTANKIGTYALAVIAKWHNIKFIVAAPRTTIDLNTPSGADIVIEERNPTEVTTVKGSSVQRMGDGTLSVGSDVHDVAVAADLYGAWNPAFDVTCHVLIDAIVTEKGVVEKGEDGEFHFEGLFSER
ncbi:S-methyl-5-thioribose-1-phosphate isomerase [Puttea exsequens]|nr:S-methyl-5-thioribose-1-phosphate isomerase [Puttea exsequens]